MATANDSPPTPNLPPSPPPAPPRIAFNPPLFIQRRVAVQELLTKFCASSRFAGKLSSALDVGCGPDCLLLRSLLPCDDDLPLEKITGIDFDEDICSETVTDSVAPGSYGGDGVAEDRWRGLAVSLLHGSFVHLSPKVVPRHDIIVSTEVIEHLDPQPLSQFAPVLLGKMKPKVCIITTPNRDFNQVFDIPFMTLDHSSQAKPITEHTALINTKNITEKSLGQPEADAADHSPTTALEAVSLGDKIDQDSMFEDPPSRTPTPSGEPDPNIIAGDSESRYWRPGVPYPMRHHDHRFEWTRSEFRAWARTAAEEFGYDVGFTGVGGIGRGMIPAGGTGYAIYKSLENAADVLFKDGAEGDTGDQLDFGEGLENLMVTQVDSFGSLEQKSNFVFGDCSQIAVFVIKKNIEKEWDEIEGISNLRARSGSRSEGTASPIFPHAWSPIFTADNWFPTMGPARDIRLVCHYSYPWVKNEEYPPHYIRVIQMVQATFNRYLPAMILEEWQKPPGVLIREQQMRKAATEGGSFRPARKNIHIDPYDLLEPLTPEVLLARKLEKQEEDEREAHRVQEQTAVMRGMAPENVRVVKMPIGSRKIWEESHQLRRACHFHYEIFRKIITSAPEDIPNFSELWSQWDEKRWVTLIDTTIREHNTSVRGDGDDDKGVNVEFQCFGGTTVIRMSTHGFRKLESEEPQSLFCRSTDNDIVFSTPNSQPVFEYSDDPEAFWNAWSNDSDCISTKSDNDNHTPDDEDHHNWDWYHNDDDNVRSFKPLELHTIAIWGADSNANFPESYSYSNIYLSSAKDKGKGVETGIRQVKIHEKVRAEDKNLDVPESGILYVGKNGAVYREEEEEWDEDDVPVLMTWHKPERAFSHYLDAMEDRSGLE